MRQKAKIPGLARRSAATVVRALAVLGLCLAGPAVAQRDNPRPTLGVIKFQDETGGMFMSGGVGRALTTMLTSELAARERFSVVERQKIYAVLEEQEMSLSGRVSADDSITIGRLTGARYLVTGTVTAYEEQDTRTTVQGGFFGRGSIREESGGGYLAVDLRVIDTGSGTIAYARSIEGRTAGEVHTYRFGESRTGTFGIAERGPGAKAVRAAVIEIIDFLECEMVVRDACREEYAARDAARIESTRRVLDTGRNRERRRDDD